MHTVYMPRMCKLVELTLEAANGSKEAACSLEKQRCIHRSSFLDHSSATQVWPLDAIAFFLVCKQYATDMISEDVETLMIQCIHFVFESRSTFASTSFLQLKRKVYSHVAGSVLISPHHLQFFASWTACMKRHKIKLEMLAPLSDAPLCVSEFFYELVFYANRLSGAAPMDDFVKCFKKLFPNSNSLSPEELKLLGVEVTPACEPLENIYSSRKS